MLLSLLLIKSNCLIIKRLDSNVNFSDVICIINNIMIFFSNILRPPVWDVLLYLHWLDLWFLFFSFFYLIFSAIKQTFWGHSSHTDRITWAESELRKVRLYVNWTRSSVHWNIFLSCINFIFSFSVFIFNSLVLTLD